MRLVLFKYYNYLYPIVYLLSIFGVKINYLSISNFSIFKKQIDKDVIAEKLKKKKYKTITNRAITTNKYYSIFYS